MLFDEFCQKNSPVESPFLPRQRTGPPARNPCPARHQLDRALVRFPFPLMSSVGSRTPRAEVKLHVVFCALLLWTYMMFLRFTHIVQDSRAH